jgi:NADH dehydrogenase FAD-containing subunit
VARACPPSRLDAGASGGGDRVKRVVLVGAGHAHLGVLRGAGALAGRGAEVVVVAPEDFWYSGLATGVLAGQYPPSLDVVPIAPLAARVGARLVRDAVAAIGVTDRRLALASGRVLDWDLLSLDVGSEVPVDAVPGAATHAVPVKPVANLVGLRADLEARWRRGERPRLVVVGGGNSGCEVAAVTASLASRSGGGLDVTLLAASSRLVPALPARAGRGVAGILATRGVRCLTGTRVTAISAEGVRTSSGEAVPGDVVVLATGLVPPRLLRQARLPIDDDGALVVEPALHAAGEPRVFGGGDCIAFGPRPLPRIGVHAVRQAPVLLHNLAASLDGRRLRPYRPQRRALLILNLGDDTALATWGPFTWLGRAAFRLKDRIDRRWLAASRA